MNAELFSRVWSDLIGRLRPAEHGLHGVDAQRIAQALVHGGVAPDAAVGWAVRTEERWEVGTGIACRNDAAIRAPIFDLASLTKPMTALAVALSRRMRVSDPIGQHVEETRGTASEDCPLELLLAHRAGLSAHLSLWEALLEDPSPKARSAALRRAADARRADALGPVPAEGFAPVYSDLGYALVGEALCRSEGLRDAGEAIEASVVRALGRDDLGTARALSARPALAFETCARPTEVVEWRGGEVRGLVHDENAWALTGAGGSGHAGMFGTVDGVLAFGAAVLDAATRGAGPLAARDRDLAWLIRPRPGGTLRAGFDGKSDAGSSAGERSGPRTFGHLGFTGTSLWIDPDASAVAVVLTNRVSPTRENGAIRVARPLVHDALFALARSRSSG